jgi:parvulin-like peptidyl-prolyl isomerase
MSRSFEGPNVRRAFRSTCWTLLALALVAGCSSDSKTIARVGSHAILADDILVTARALAARGALPPDSAKTKLLNAMIQRELLVQGAQRLGFHRDTTFLDLREKSQHDLLRDRMVGELVAGPVEVSESELELLHRWRDQESRARVIFTPSREAAEAAAAQIRGGIDFALVANRFNPQGFTPPGGDIGFVAPGYLQPPLDDVVRTAVPGRLYGPIEAPSQGWFVVRVEERRPRQGQPLEQERAMLTEVIRQRKQVVTVVRAVDRLKEAYGVHVREGASQELMTRALRSLSDSTGRLPALGLGEQAVTLVDYRGGAYTLGEAYREIQAGAVQRPNFQSLASVDHWLEARAIERVLLAEARARKYDEDPALQRALRERENDWLIQTFYNRLVLVPVQATPEQAAAFYARNPQANVALGQVKVLTVTLRDSAAAHQLAAAAPHMPGLREAVAAAGLPAAVQSETVQYPTPDPIWSALEQYLRDTPPGGYAGPFGLPTGWMLVQLIDKAQAPPSFDTLPETTKQSVIALATDELRQERLRALTDSLRTELHVTVYTKRLDRLVLPANQMSLGALTGQ